jgi:hypothetical protein
MDEPVRELSCQGDEQEARSESCGFCFSGGVENLFS